MDSPQQSGQAGEQFQHQPTGQTSGTYGGTPQGGGQSMGRRLQDVETPQQRETVGNILRAIEVCEWCADQCIQHADPNMVECIRLCEDVSELGETAITLIPRRSRYAHEQTGTFLQAVEACAQECSQHSHAHCQECAEVLQGTSQAVQQFLASFGQQSGQTNQQVARQGGYQ